MGKKGFKKFPFAWRANWLKLMQESPTAAAVWAYMWWRSDEHGVFDLCEDLMCLDLNLNPKTLQKARALIHRMGGFKRECERNDKGQLIVRYRMLPFTNPSTEIYLSPTPNIGCESLSQKTVAEPSPNLLSTEKRGHTVDTVSVTSSPSVTPIPESGAVDTSKTMKEGRKEGNPPLASLATDKVPPAEKPDEQEKPLESGDGQAKGVIPTEPGLREVWIAWIGLTGIPWSANDAIAAEQLIKYWGADSIVSYLHDTGECPKTAKILWKDFAYWASSLGKNGLTKRTIDAWNRAKNACDIRDQKEIWRKEELGKPTPKYPSCDRCHGTCWNGGAKGEPGVDDHRIYCTDCRKLPRYRRDPQEKSGPEAVCVDCGAEGRNVEDYPRCKPCLEKFD